MGPAGLIIILWLWCGKSLPLRWDGIVDAR